MDGCTNGRSFTFGIDERIGFVWPACNSALQGYFEAFTGSTDKHSGPSAQQLWSLNLFDRHINTCSTGFSGRKFVDMVFSE